MLLGLEGLACLGTSSEVDSRHGLEFRARVYDSGLGLDFLCDIFAFPKPRNHTGKLFNLLQLLPAAVVAP